MPAVPAVARFRKLIDNISRLYLNARRAQVRFAWETGRLIVLEEQNGETRAAYGKELIPKLSKELTKKYGAGFSVNVLWKMRQFFLLNRILPATVELDWTDYVELLPVRDEKTRKRLEERILKEDLSARQIREVVREVRDLPKPAKLPPLKRPADLRLDTFAVSALPKKLKEGFVLVDCGFFVCLPVTKEELKAVNTSGEMSYTYAAEVERVIDGDTLLVLIEVGFGIIVRDKLRLRGVDTPEVGTPEGDRAKRFVEKLLPPGSVVVIKSHKWKTDPHGRFVADVFIPLLPKSADNNREAMEYPASPEGASRGYHSGQSPGADDPEAIIKNGTYLNQELLDRGHAVRMAE